MDFSTQDIRKAQEMAQKLKGKSDGDAIASLAQMIRSGQGGISVEKAEQMISMLLPMVDDAQRRKLQQLIREIRG